MKSYDVQQQAGNLQWHTLGYLRSKKDAEKYESLYNTKVVIYPTKVIEHKFIDLKRFENEFED